MKKPVEEVKKSEDKRSEKSKSSSKSSSKSRDDYKPAWGQFDPQIEKKSSETRIGFKHKKSKTPQSVHSLKVLLSEKKSPEVDETKESDKKVSPTNWEQNVEQMKKSLNK